MADIYRITLVAFAAFFFLPGVALSGNDNPDDDPYNDLFDYGYGSAPKRERERITNCRYDTGTGQETGSQTSGSACASVTGGRMLSHVQSTVDGTYTCSIGSTNYATNTPDYVRGSVSIVCTTSAPGQSNINASGGFTWTQSFGAEVDMCPPDGQLQSTHMNNVGDANLCFDPVDLAQRDSCPDSTQDGDYLLPSGTNTSTNICRENSDGSMCAYTKQGDIYVADFETSCYSTVSDEYNDTGLSHPDPNAGCQDIGQGVTACPEDPLNVCNQTGNVNGEGYYECLEGCGRVEFKGQSSFMCLSDDTDADGIGDYADPDIDGDGIPNNQDTDADGDGTDDPVYGDDPAPGAVTVNVDNSGIESRLDTLNATSDDARNGIGAVNDKLDGILTEVRKITNDDGSVTFDNMNPSEGLTGFYDAEYPNGFTDVWTANEEGFNNSTVVAYIDSWKLTVSGEYTYPQFCVDVIVNLGCHELSIDSRVMPFIRVIMIISALFLARKITLGA